MLDLNEIKPGRCYSVVYSAPVEMVGKREFDLSEVANNPALRALLANQKPELLGITCGAVKLENPIAGMALDVRRVSTVQAAGNETWGNVQRKANPDWEKSERKAWYHACKENECLVEHNTSGQRYLRGLPRGVTVEEYTFGGAVASPDIVNLAKLFKKGKGEAAEFILVKLENLANAVE